MTKRLGTLNVDAGDAGPISLEITTSTSLERIAAVLRFSDEMTTDKPVDAPAGKPANAPDPPLPAKTKTPRAAKKAKTTTLPPSRSASMVASLECDECGRTFGTANSVKIHKGRVHKPELKSAGDSQPSSEMGPDAQLHRCDDCEFTAPVTAFGSGIGAHARMRHHREPTAAEKTPRTQADVDSAEEAVG